MKTMYYNKCRVCGTTLVTDHKLESCEACGSDDMYSRKHKVEDKVDACSSSEEAEVAAAIEQAEAECIKNSTALAKKIIFIGKALAAAAAAIGAAFLLKLVLGL